MSIVVTTPTGNIGSVVVDRLLAAGRTDVAVIARNPDRLSESVRGRVKVYAGDVTDAASVRKATEGAEALFWLTPPNFGAHDWKAFYEQVAVVAADAVKANGIPYVVDVSSGGADRASGWGPVSYLQIIENALAATGANVLHLRPGFFYENFLMQVEPMAATGKVYYGVPAETVYPMIATRDIGEAAARKLLARDWSGVSILGLHGPAEQPSFAGAARILGEAIGRPVEYVQVPLEAVKGQVMQSGGSASVAEAYAELVAALGRGEQPAEARTPETTTPTTLRQWAEEVLRPAVQSLVK